MGYRPEIDGLRAIAVLAVVLFHAGIGSAGFVGVDVFFVISGYLITSLLLKEHHATGSINLLAFYARRVRRIFPAAAVVVLATLAASHLLLDPEAQAKTANSAGAALVFGANVFFQLTTGGYWDGASEEMPLLHLWSLSVEEQFYFLWPALLLFTRSRRMMAGLAIASLVLAEFWIARESQAAFYQMPSRFWELAAGGLVAVTPRKLPGWCSTAGVALTLGACLYPLGHFPGIGALPAVLGAALVCASRGNRFLASKPMVGVGLISYSLYLWHWPLLAIYKANGGEYLQTRLALCGVAVLLAVASYRYVEQPFRRMRIPSGRTVAVGASTSLLLALSACAIGYREVAPPSPLDRSNEAQARRIELDQLPRDCEYNPGDTLPKCPDPPNAKVAIWGDSTALAWSAGLDNPMRYTMPSCPPVVGYAGKTKGCAKFNELVPERLAKAGVVYLSANWSVYEFDLTESLEQLKGRVVILGPTPHMQASVPRCLRTGKTCQINRWTFDKEAEPILAKLRKQAAPFPNVEVRDLTEDFCDDTFCPPIRNGIGLYWDEHHVSVSQARSVLARTP